MNDFHNIVFDIVILTKQTTLNQRKGDKVMTYAKPEILAQNSAQGTFAAGCPTQGQGGPGSGTCRRCERTG